MKTRLEVKRLRESYLTKRDGVYESLASNDDPRDIKPLEDLEKEASAKIAVLGWVLEPGLFGLLSEEDVDIRRNLNALIKTTESEIKMDYANCDNPKYYEYYHRLSGRLEAYKTVLKLFDQIKNITKNEDEQHVGR